MPRAFFRTLLILAAAAGCACAGTQLAAPGDWLRPGASSPGAAVPAWEGMEPLAAEEALRAAVKPPSLCFQDPRACGLEAPAFTLSALRPDERHLDAVQAALARHATAWPRESRLLHCESLAAWRPAAGRECTRDLADPGSLHDPVQRARLLPLLDALGRHGNALTTAWLVDGDVEVRRDVAHWLSTRAADGALVEPIARALDQEPDERAALDLVRALDLLRDPRTALLLGRIARTRGQPRVSAAAVDVLAVVTHRRLLEDLRYLDTAHPTMRSAVDRARRLHHVTLRDTPEAVPAELGGGFEFITSHSSPVVGGLAFLEDFKRLRERSLLFEPGESLTPDELRLLMARLSDAGGFGLEVARTSLATSCGAAHLEALLDLRRAIHVAGLPDRERLAFDLTEVVQVVRTHHVLRRPTRYWRALPGAAVAAAY
ncbi:MAG: hypothetical protein HY904_12540 [Deltaproteobacteria bacterium]|nr:hypothetical protein [Deltaproteobacteria bacterium]